MPSIEWNKKAWTDHFKKFSSSKDMPYYGDCFGVTEDNFLNYFIKKHILKKNIPGNLAQVNKKYIKPYVGTDKVVLEIGSGGGRWTKYLVAAKKLVIVDLNSVFFPYLEKRFSESTGKMKFYHTSGYEMNGIDSDSIDFVFTFGTFVHIEPDGIFAYLAEIKRVLKPGAIAVIQYADKTKKRAQELKGFTDMNPGKMEEYIRAQELKLIEHNTRLMSQSNIAVMSK